MCIVRGTLPILTVLLLGPAPASAQLTIVPTFAANIQNDPNGAIIMSTINQAIAEYHAHYSDNITVRITFQEGGGLGSSSTSLITTTYVNYRAALVSHATTADDFAVLSHLPNQTTTPVNGGLNVSMARANARALGLVGRAALKTAPSH